MNLHRLAELAAKGEIRELELLSLEGGVYLARVRLEHTETTLQGDDQQPLRIRSTTHLRDLLQGIPPFPCVLYSTAFTMKCAARVKGRLAGCGLRLR